MTPYIGAKMKSSQSSDTWVFDPANYPLSSLSKVFEENYGFTWDQEELGLADLQIKMPAKLILTFDLFYYLAKEGKASE
tara:strand:+ start:724 stop:960 length:237 start_codon:yes stop_codon:yes gene_type:complete